MQLLLRCILGYFTQKDQSFCSNDSLLSRFKTFCSQPTVSRFFDRISVSTNMMLKEAITKQACEYVNNHITDPIIDADSTLVNSYGKQEASSYIYHYKEIGYHPLLINEFKSGLLLSSQLRTGNSYSSNGIIEELEPVLTFLKKDKVSFRGDSAFMTRI